MKKKSNLLPILMAVGGLLPDWCAGQSTFYFSNLVPAAGVDAPVFDNAGDRLFGSTYVAMLYGGPTSGSLQPAWDEVLFREMSPVPLTYTPTGLAGYFRYVGYVQIGNVFGGGLAWLQVRVWDTRLGSTYEEVVGLGLGGYGESNLFQKRGGDPNLGVPTPPEPLVGLQSFSLRPVVPEPSTWALLALGALPLLLWTRITTNVCQCWR